jgi:hypothetical protein
MNRERYRQIDALVEAALQIDGCLRLDFLQRACGSDQDLLERVVALLKSYETATDFLEKPAFEAWARDVAEANCGQSLEGRQVGRYQVLSHLGSGGIGDVWLARDTELSREVALKFLSPELALDSGQTVRFRQEARVASSLNHPNLVTIFDRNMFQAKQCEMLSPPGRSTWKLLRTLRFRLRAGCGQRTPPAWFTVISSRRTS